LKAKSKAIKQLLNWKVWYGIVEFNVTLDAV